MAVEIIRHPTKVRVRRILAHWWNGSWGGLGKRDVWVELISCGCYRVRWRGGEWRDRDARNWQKTRNGAWEIVRQLIGDGDGWRRVDA